MLHNNIKQSLRTNEKNDISPPCKPTSGGQVSLQLHPGRENQKKNLPVPTECNNRQSETREKFFILFYYFIIFIRNKRKLVLAPLPDS